MPQLAVFVNRARLGTITLHEQSEQYELAYANSWRNGLGYAISPHLRPGEAESGAVKRFLANLLPEGRWLEELSVINQVSKNNIFGLVALIGAETTGALSFQFDGHQEPWPTEFRPVGLAELKERIASRGTVSILNWDGKPRLSVAGVQDKLPILIRPDGEMGFGEGELASTHILKFGREPALHMVINEYLCMTLARRVMLPAAKVYLARWGEPVLQVDRFDRLWNNVGGVERLHLIDGCQMLDLPPTYKYERPFGTSGEAARIRTGASLPKLFAACHKCRIPARAIRDLLNWVLFQLLIENSDAHAKNISFFVTKAGIDLAPSYDLLNVGIYGEKFENHLAMAIGDEFDLAEVMPYQLAEMCAECKLPQKLVSNRLKELCSKILVSLETLPLDIFTDDEKAFAMALADRIKKNAERFSEIAKELPRVKL